MKTKLVPWEFPHARKILRKSERDAREFPYTQSIPYDSK
jgi:hypothetical protein